MHTLSIKYRVIIWLLSAPLLLVLSATGTRAAKSVEGTVPQAASAVARQIDRQLTGRLMQGESPAVGVSLAVMVPVDINNLDVSNPLARQMAEELSRWFVQAGYGVQEIRKGRMVLMEPGNGEKLLTRRTNHLANNNVDSTAILTGTYTITNKNVRFNIRMLHTATQDVLGMATISVPITGEVKSLLGMADSSSQTRSLVGIGPSVGTTFP